MKSKEHAARCLTEAEARFGSLESIRRFDFHEGLGVYVFRVTAFSRLLEEKDLELEVDSIPDDISAEYRAAFRSFFCKLSRDERSYYLSFHWIGRLLNNGSFLGSSKESKGKLIKKLVGPVACIFSSRPYVGSVVSSQMTERSAGMILFSGGEMVIRGHDDFGCLVACSNLGVARKAESVAKNEGLHFISLNR